MRARWLKPEFFADKKIAQLGPIAALVYEALWCMADDGGTAPCDADTVKAQMFYRWSAVGVPEISEALRHLSDAGRIVCYTVGDDTYCRIPTWKKHQQVHKPSKFRYPSMPQGDTPITPGDSGTSAAPLPASPPPRHLDSQTPRHPTKGADKPRNGKRPSEPAPWMGLMRKAWSLGELLEGDATLLRRVVADVGPEEAASRLANYCEQVDTQFATVRAFVSKHAMYAGQGRLAVDPETGLPNAIGMAALSGRGR
jgi:hypothetical protein